MTMRALPTQGSTDWYGHYSDMDGEARKQRRYLVDRGIPGSDGMNRAVRVQDSPVYSAATAGLGSIYYPYVMRVDTILDNPIDTYYMWFSQDHDANGQICLSTGPSRTGPWTFQGVVTTQAAHGGDSSQGPSIIWNTEDPVTPFWCYYQSGTSTSLIKSADGITWTFFGDVIVVPYKLTDSVDATEQPGQRRTGYAKVIKIGSFWMAYHVNGGGGYSHYGVSYSHNGEQWQTDPRLLYWNVDMTNDVARQFTMLDAIQVAGKWWGVGIEGIDGDYSIACAPLSGSMRTYLGRVRPLLGVERPWEGTYIRSHTFLVDDDRLWMYYSTDANTVGLAEVS